MNITDPRFKYTPSHKTDIRELFKKIRKELADQRNKHDETKQVVRQIKVADK